jgi:tetratricopeptide (TPR) repeat protein
MKFRSKAMTGMLALLTILSSAGCSKLKARDEMNKGVRSFKDSKYETAVEHFKAAVDLDPELTNAHLYLAAAYASQYQPGGDSPENKRIGEEAIKAYENVLVKDPGNVGSVSGIAGIYFNMKNFAKAKEYYKKRTELEPNSPEPFYSIGNVNWILCYNKQDPLPTEQKKVLIEEGLTNLEKAVQNDPNYYNAYFYINLLLRQKAQVIIDELTDANPKLKDQFAMAALDPKSLDPMVKKHAGSRYEDYQGYLKKADENFEKAMQIRKEVEAKAETKGVVDPTK